MATSHKKSSVSKAVSSRSSAPRASRRVTVPTADELEVAREDALLQLKIGRSAHYYSVLVSLALFFAGFLVLFLRPSLATSDSAVVQSNFFLAFTVISGLYLALVGIRIKWEAYQLWPWESHFWVTVLSVLLNGFLVALYLLSTLHYGPTQHWPLIPWLYPLALLGVGAPLAGMALTWGEWSRRKTISVACALLPAFLAFVLYIPDVSAQNVVNALAGSLFVAALLFQTSGSFLHLISSGTQSHEREVINSGQNRLFQIADEVRQKEETIRFRESKVIQREAEVEAAEASLRRKVEANDVARSQLTGIEQELSVLSDQLDKRQAEVAARAAETSSLARSLEDKEQTLTLQRQEVERLRARLSGREQDIATREAEMRRQGVQVSQREQELQRRLQSIPDAEARLEARRQDLEKKTAELFRVESQLKTRQSMGGAPKAEQAAGPKLADLENREAQLAHLKQTLDEQNLTLGRKAKQVETDRQELAAKESELAQREMALSSRESVATQREKEGKETSESADQRRKEYEEATRRYESRVALLDRRDAELSSRASEIERLQKGLELKDLTVKGQAERLAQDRTALDRLQRTLIERQKEVEAREEEFKSRGVGGEGATTRPATGTGGPALGQTTLVEATLAPASNQRFADRVSTGTARLDDLLLGGVPPNGHLLLVGDPFIGKEIVLYAYIAEGLKRDESVILITSTRDPDEVTQQLKEVLPNVGEYERKGRIQWIDATKASDSAVPASGATHPSAAANGPDDHAGILKALVAAVKKAEGSGSKRLRVGFLGLSASLAHADEKAGFVFLQNFVGILKPRPATAIYSLEEGALTEAQVERLLTRMDGAIRFKQERDKTFLSVAGVGEVATRDWVECRSTKKGIIIGSFSLERIR